MFLLGPLKGGCMEGNYMLTLLLTWMGIFILSILTSILIFKDRHRTEKVKSNAVVFLLALSCFSMFSIFLELIPPFPLFDLLIMISVAICPPIILWAIVLKRER